MFFHLPRRKRRRKKIRKATSVSHATAFRRQYHTWVRGIILDMTQLRFHANLAEIKVFANYPSDATRQVTEPNFWHMK